MEYFNPGFGIFIMHSLSGSSLKLDPDLQTNNSYLVQYIRAPGNYLLSWKGVNNQGIKVNKGI